MAGRAGQAPGAGRQGSGAARVLRSSFLSGIGDRAQRPGQRGGARGVRRRKPFSGRRRRCIRGARPTVACDVRPQGITSLNDPVTVRGLD
jgi:hypothetical protein